MQLTLTYVRRDERTSKNTGKPFTSLSIKAKEYGDKFISGFGNKTNASWKEGDVVEVAAVTEKPGRNKNGENVVYLNFEMPKSPSADPLIFGKMVIDLGNLNRKLDKIIDHLSGKEKMGVTSEGTQIPFQDAPDDGFDAWAEGEAEKI